MYIVFTSSWPWMTTSSLRLWDPATSPAPASMVVGCGRRRRGDGGGGGENGGLRVVLGSLGILFKE